MHVYKGGNRSLERLAQAHPPKFRSQGRPLPIGTPAQAAQSRLGFVMAQKENGDIGLNSIKIISFFNQRAIF